MRTLLFFYLAVSSIAVQAQVYDVTTFGAVGNGTTKNTAAIQEAIDSATANGGGTVYFPAGTFISATLILKDNVTLHIDSGATLKGSPDLSDYPDINLPQASYTDNYPQRSLLYAEGAKNISLKGPGTFDGNGQSNDFLFNADDKPYGWRFVQCQNVLVENITLRQSGFWMMHNFDCDTLTIRNVTLYNHAFGNNDGLSIDGCREVLIENCKVDANNDPIVIKATGLVANENVEVRNCTVATFQRSIKIGTETNGSFKNIHIHDIVVQQSAVFIPNVSQNPTVGINLAIVDGGSMENVLVENIEMTDVQTPFFIRLGNRARRYDDNIPINNVGSLKGVTLRNIDVVATTNITSSITGIPGYYAENITLENIDVKYPGGWADVSAGFTVPENETGKPEAFMFGDTLPASGIYVRHVKDISFMNVCFTADSIDQRDIYRFEDVIPQPDVFPTLHFGHNSIKTCISDIPSGIQQVSVNTVKLYPNPATDQLYLDISYHNNAPLSFRLFDLTGKQVFLKEMSQSAPIDVSQLKGFYLYQLVEQNTILQTGKLVIN